MRELFPGWVPPDEETLDQYWSTATFAVDTSVLLDLYRFSEEARSGLLEALRSFQERLWIPHQVGLEFHRNRFGVLLAQREAEDNLLSELDQIRKDLDSQLSQRLRGAGRRDLAPLREAVDGGFESLREKLSEAEKEHTKGLGESTTDDPIYEEVAALCADRVGPPFDSERHAEVSADAEERIRTKTPPGYLDAGKEDGLQYGDAILWQQLCDRAAETKKPVVLVSDDQKVDWVWEERGKTLGPRPELVAEMRDRAGVGFHIYTPTRLLQIWKQREEGQEVAPAVLEEIEGSTEPEQVVALKHHSILRRYLDSINRLTESDEKVNDSLLIPTFAKAAEKFRSRASHQIGLDHVELGLEFWPLTVLDSVSAVRVTVKPSRGEASVRMLPLSRVLPPPVSLSSSYPGDFRGVEDLRAGTYEVIWEALALVVDEDEAGTLTEKTAEIARDIFVISDWRQGLQLEDLG
jgi:hypothetical protein